MLTNPQYFFVGFTLFWTKGLRRQNFDSKEFAIIYLFRVVFAVIHLFDLQSCTPNNYLNLLIANNNKYYQVIYMLICFFRFW